MKRLRLAVTLIVFSICVLLFLSSCRPVEKEYFESTDMTVIDTTVGSEEKEPSEATLDTTDKPITLPCLIGLYDDLQENGTYTRLYEWNQSWMTGKDIAVFDVIPSEKEQLIGSSYKKLWLAEAERISKDQLPKPYFELSYTLIDGTVKTASIYSYSDAERIINEGYLEVYLYDDIHQEDGAWYYHLTKDTTNEETVISSFKLTAGKMIESVKNIRLTAYIDGSSGAVVNITNIQ